MKLAIDGGTPVRSAPWPSWPPPLSAGQRELVTEVLESGLWGATQGSLCTDLAAAFAARSAVPYGVTVGNATLGLFAALRGLGVGPGDEVIVPAYTFVASATSVILAGATPVIVDVDPVDLHLSPAAVEAAVTPRTAAIMPVHLAGSPADMDGLTAVAVRHGLAVVEDCAQSHGALYRDRPVGGLGDAGVFSFQASKAMTAGEGGVIVCRDEGVHARTWSTCNLGRRLGGEWYGHPEVGWNLRMTEIQAALLLPWLDRLEEEIARRNAFCEAVERGLGRLSVPWGPAASAGSGAGGAAVSSSAEPDRSRPPVTVVPQPPGTTLDSRHLLMLRVDAPVDREFLLAAMAAEGVPLDGGYPPLGTMSALVEAGARVEPCPAAEAASRTVVWVRQSMLMEEAAGASDVVEALAKVLGADR
ncbi:DegT/DnrJ/EryC1/StrS family aminotransferase [Streptosporangium roseum]|uniref:PLP-dependent transaminase n=1 Tax=Streptosporangium roseum (strain ATCC 12428 / DSM 43021 / JCM 3005 / KCTC 9067 / NCIMB 10171 / NRRL 2505 / NI 9100) TaxID=479432 RepID=D2B190_STRRD|nr:DegT/DnrJ/EryC1/StrS family aminotransferase [Streptosporangium roseum]ACZ85355.1 PLP-dependent transaminase [Streptosporangium roseum DSM 43021]